MAAAPAAASADAAAVWFDASVGAEADCAWTQPAKKAVAASAKASSLMLSGKYVVLWWPGRNGKEGAE